MGARKCSTTEDVMTEFIELIGKLMELSPLLVDGRMSVKKGCSMVRELDRVVKKASRCSRIRSLR